MDPQAASSQSAVPDNERKGNDKACNSLIEVPHTFHLFSDEIVTFSTATAGLTLGTFLAIGPVHNSRDRSQDRNIEANVKNSSLKTCHYKTGYYHSRKYHIYHIIYNDQVSVTYEVLKHTLVSRTFYQNNFVHGSCFLCLVAVFRYIFPRITTQGVENFKYRQTSYISRIKSQNLNFSRLVLQMSLHNPLKPGVKSRMKM